MEHVRDSAFNVFDVALNAARKSDGIEAMSGGEHLI
jgi:hypothetical protein